MLPSSTDDVVAEDLVLFRKTGVDIVLGRVLFVRGKRLGVFETDASVLEGVVL